MEVNTVLISLERYDELIDEINQLRKYNCEFKNEYKNMIKDYINVENKIIKDIISQNKNIIEKIDYKNKSSYYYQKIVEEIQDRGYTSLDIIDRIINKIINYEIAEVNDEK